MVRFRQANLSALIFVLIAVVCIAFFSVQTTADTAFASGDSFDAANVLDDLKSSTVNGKPFDIRNYPYNENGALNVLNFVEFGYSYKSNLRKNYALYIYIYNPKGVNISVDNKRNKIQMAVGYNAKNEPTRYEKFNLIFCNKSDGNYKNLFYKFKVSDRKIDDKTFADRVNSNERRYDISGIELLTYGNPNATEYTVGGSYLFTGYAKGLGADTGAESTLNCAVQSLETLELNVNHTYYRTNVSNLGKDHYNEVNTVYFSVPDRIFNTYGYLQKIRAEWWEYKTKKAAVTSNKELYENLLKYIGKDVGEYDATVPVRLGYGYSGRAGTSLGQATVHNWDWTYNIDLSAKKTIFGTASSISFSKEIQTIMPYAFYSPVTDVDSVFDFLYSKPVAGNVEGTVVADWIYNYSNNLGHGYIDCNGRKISNDLFTNSVDSGRKHGHNDKTIDLSDTFDLHSYDSNHTWWNKLWDYGFSWPKTDGDYKNIAPIYELKSSDLIGTDKQIADKLLVNGKDVTNLRTYYAKETAKNNKVILFRFATTDYMCGIASATGATNNPDTYIAQQTVFLDFDIIELTFNKEGVYHVIPVVSSPTDIINGFTAPPKKFQAWKLILAIVLFVLLLILLLPILPYILKAIWWVITLPFKAVKSLCVKIKERRTNKETK